ncbi:bifunctional (p)ppGpp synthetase/guanosine-3',5'-bis(diphosphate) 3'-pyrophosphohydrolase [archaeon]|jgi:GTP diphosphokinase / guanosine-3',5'-bis(diphosphate) 3'-diphosphatase|nr:bifunctional (p)ppGpp synthetase/guanosine-3',5'-bis(diphosphate) 3'-pyrophosphohydrolase [archaeon]MBT4647936.1 bifunctional (p)ppGpp synthetase/guanosine-3',5'-bis(diphosphate) 3'-pyrophosphohydrolase [archaeon]MBT7393170.1 bifunctional (p)ppGpp synthetase/guanosine-3',5'-bis(diphosphate) 3'-pyrophosphohydrolase [archaeon]
MDKELKFIIDEVKKYDKRVDVSIIEKSYDIAKDAHQGQKRMSGEDFLNHPLEVTKILIELHADCPTICAGLLHDVVEDSPLSLNKIKKEFDSEIAKLVEAATKTSKVSFDSPENYTAENLRKILFATIKDPRVMFLKLADRLHNMRTLKHLRDEKAKRVAKETMDIYAPIAHKLGLYSIKGELEDLSMRYLLPEMYQYIKTKINSKREEREEKANVLIKAVKKTFTEMDLKYYDVSGRAKYFHSIYKKMKKRNKSFDEIYDLIAIRIIVENVSDCYRVLALIHQVWKPIPGRFKDYIAVPKSNGYQSLHTDVATEFGSILEVQIRTLDMHYVAKYGVAAHWRYKGTERDKMFDRRVAWLEQVLDWKKKAGSEFLDTFKVNFFQDEIVVFTPKGDPIILAEGSTPIDFGFEVHSWVGSHCVKAEVNGKVVSLDTKLTSGDIISIITQNNAKPSRNWLNYVVTNKAKQRIRSELKLEIDRDPKQMRLEEEIVNLSKFIGFSGKKRPVKISKCCSPGLKDKIVGYITKDKALTVHKSGCSNIFALDQKKKVDVKWDIPHEKILKLKVYVNDKLGMVTKILNTIAQRKLSVLSVNVRPNKKTILISLEIKPENDDDEEEIVNILKEIKNVLTVVCNKKTY